MAGWNDDTKRVFMKWATDNKPKPAAPIKPRTKTCPHCLKEYEMGINGTVDGCDTCEGIVRLPSGMIDYGASSPEVFIKQESTS